MSMKSRFRKDWVEVKIRMPPDLHAQLVTAAEENVRSVNAEMIARLRAAASLVEKLRAGEPPLDRGLGVPKKSFAETFSAEEALMDHFFRAKAGDTA